VVLEYTYDQVDYISMHRYYENEGNIEDFLASFAGMNEFIKTVTATADYVKAKVRSQKTMKISFDEWNVWYIKKQTRIPWAEAPAILEDRYSLLDALVFGGMLCTLLNNCDRIKMACLAQLVNVIAPIFTEKGGRILKQATYYPFQQVSLFGQGIALKTLTDSGKFSTSLYGDVPAVQTAATYNPQDGSITVFALNCNMEDDAELLLDLRSFGSVIMQEHWIMDGPDLFAHNTFEAPGTVIPRYNSVTNDHNPITTRLPKLSWNMFRFKTCGCNGV
jgi:alpha-N-arabinofuranosidase